jgi:hypothetical protein
MKATFNLVVLDHDEPGSNVVLEINCDGSVEEHNLLSLTLEPAEVEILAGLLQSASRASGLGSSVCVRVQDVTGHLNPVDIKAAVEDLDSREDRKIGV